MVINPLQSVLPVALPFTIICISEVVRINCICVVETLGNSVLLHISSQLHNNISLGSQDGKIYTTMDTGTQKLAAATK